MAAGRGAMARWRAGRPDAYNRLRLIRLEADVDGVVGQARLGQARHMGWGRFHSRRPAE